MKTISQLLHDYLAYYAITEKQHSQQVRDYTVTKPLLAIARLIPTQVTPELLAKTITEWSKSYGKAGYKPSTVRQTIFKVKHFWKWLRMKKIITRKQWSDLWDDELLSELPKRFPNKRRVLPQHRVDKANTLLQFALPLAQEEPRGVATIALLGLTMGFRVGEILAFVPDDLDNGCQLLWVVDPKTVAGQRQVEVPTILVDILTTVKAMTRPGERLFPYNNNQVYPRVKKLCAATGLIPLGTHALRRTNATLRELSEQNPDQIIRTLGHTNIGMSRGTYVEPGTVEKVGQKRVARHLKF